MMYDHVVAISTKDNSLPAKRKACKQKTIVACVTKQVKTQPLSLPGKGAKHPVPSTLMVKYLWRNFYI
jgi:hypothetical protein